MTTSTPFGGFGSDSPLHQPPRASPRKVSGTFESTFETEGLPRGRSLAPSKRAPSKRAPSKRVARSGHRRKRPRGTGVRGRDFSGDVHHRPGAGALNEENDLHAPVHDGLDRRLASSLRSERLLPPPRSHSHRPLPCLATFIAGKGEAAGGEGKAALTTRRLVTGRSGSIIPVCGPAQGRECDGTPRGPANQVRAS